MNVVFSTLHQIYLLVANHKYSLFSIEIVQYFPIRMLIVVIIGWGVSAR